MSVEELRSWQAGEIETGEMWTDSLDAFDELARRNRLLEEAATRLYDRRTSESMELMRAALKANRGET